MIQHRSDPWRGLRLKLILRRILDPGLVVFGADEHRYRLNSPLSIDKLREFEALHSVSLPRDYADFLLNAGNGGAGPYYGLYRLEEAPIYGDLAKPFALTEEWEMPDDQEPEYKVPSSYRDGCLALAEHGCGYYSFLVVTGPAAGTVWEDYTCAGKGIYPTTVGFSTWYRKWLRFLG